MTTTRNHRTLLEYLRKFIARVSLVLNTVVTFNVFKYVQYINYVSNIQHI